MKKVSTGSLSVVSGKKVSIGIDVHKDSWHVTARTDGSRYSTVTSLLPTIL